MEKFGLYIAGLFIVASVLLSSANNAYAVGDSDALVAKLMDAPINFIENRGQLDKKTLFYTKSKDYTTLFTKDSVYIEPIISKGAASVCNHKQNNSGNNTEDHKGGVFRSIKLSFYGSNKDVVLVANDINQGKVNYFLGNNPKKWRVNIPTYKSITYKNVYKGIDIIFYGNNRKLEYDVVVSPGVDPSVVKLVYNGIDKLDLANNGDLNITHKYGRLIQKRPLVYQILNNKKVEVESGFVIKSDSNDNNTYNLSNAETTHNIDKFISGFKVASYDTDQPLIIDPQLVYSTYLGGNHIDYANAVKADSSGNVYVTGLTQSGDFPTSSAFQGSISSGADMFVTKFNSSGSLMYSTYLGGGSGDEGFDIEVDTSGNIYITGTTWSTDFPTVSAFQNNRGGVNNVSNSDAFLTKLNSNGNAIIFSTYLGGAESDKGRSLAIDTSQNIYITGDTFSTDFPTLSSFQNTLAGRGDAFVSKFNATGSTLAYSTYLGESGEDHCYSIAVDSNGNAYVTGSTQSLSIFPTKNAFQPGFGGHTDAFVTKFNASGNDLVYSTYLGGSDGEVGYGIAVNTSGNAYVTGQTSSSNFPVQAAFQGVIAGNNDAFITKFNSTGTGIEYSTYLGGANFDAGESITIDNAGNVYVAGESQSSNFPIVSAVQEEHAGSGDVFFARLNSTGANLDYSSYFGGARTDVSPDIGIDANENVYLVGKTDSTDFPTKSAFQGSFGGGTPDAFIAKFEPKAEPPTISFTATPTSGLAPLAVQFTDSSTGSIDSWAWTFGDENTSVEQSPSHTFTTAGNFAVSLTVTGAGGSSTETKANFITVTEPAPVADFTADVTSGETPLTVSFTNISTGNITSWSWEFGDVATSSEESPSHTYTTAGNFTVSLTVSGPGGIDTVTKADFISLTAIPPLAAFTTDRTNGIAPLTVQFTDQSTGTIDSRLWEFGDGSSSVEPNPSHTYDVSDVYIVKLTVTGPAGKNETTSTITVEPKIGNLISITAEPSAIDNKAVSNIENNVNVTITGDPGLDVNTIYLRAFDSNNGILMPQSAQFHGNELGSNKGLNITETSSGVYTGMMRLFDNLASASIKIWAVTGNTIPVLESDWLNKVISQPITVDNIAPTVNADAEYSDANKSVTVIFSEEINGSTIAKPESFPIVRSLASNSQVIKTVAGFIASDHAKVSYELAEEPSVSDNYIVDFNSALTDTAGNRINDINQIGIDIAAFDVFIPTPTPEPTPDVTPKPTATPTTPTISTPTPEITVTPEHTPEPTQTITPLPESTITPTPKPQTTSTPAPAKLTTLKVNPNSSKKSLKPKDAIVTALDQNGNSLKGLKVTARAEGKRVSVNPPSGITNEDGIVKFKFRFGLLSRNGRITFTAGDLKTDIVQE